MFNRENREKRKRMKITPKNIPEKNLNDDESFGNQEPLGGKEEPFGKDEPFGKQEPFGGKEEPFGKDEPFGKQESFGGKEDPFGKDEPFGNQEPFGGKEESFGNDEPFGNQEPFGGKEESFGNDETDNYIGFEGKPLVVDPDTTYFFVFGLGSAGKSVMLSGLIYYLSAIHRKGQIKSTGDRDTDNHKRGDAILSKMRRKVRSGKFVDRSKQIDKNEFVFPSEIHLKYVPSMSENKYEMPFCLLEMAGEDLKEIKLKDDGKSGGEFDERINSYLMHPNCSIAFICVVDPDELAESEDVIIEFISYLEKIGRTTNPALIAVSKWDRFKEEYNNNVDKYFDDNIKILDRITEDEDREFTKMGFSIGSVSEDDTSYDFKPSDSEKLFKWMYEIAIGIPFDQEITPSFFSKALSSIKTMFSK